MKIRINLNEKVKFKLSERGKEIYRHRYDGYGFEYDREPKLDDDGYMSMQLWTFMQIFGEHMIMGMSEVLSPLEIVFDTEDLEACKKQKSKLESDTISRQVAIEEIALHDPTNGTEPYFSGHEVIDILKCVSPVESKPVCEDCIDRYAALAELDPQSYEYKVVKELPSVEPERPEIIRCKNCRYDNNCEIQYAAQAGSKFFCGAAERQEGMLPVKPERPKGEWVDRDGWSYCSNCEKYATPHNNGCEIEPCHTPFCPWCGADMRGKEDEK